MKIIVTILCLCLLACGEVKRKDLSTEKSEIRPEIRKDSVIILKMQIKKGEQFFFGYTDDLYNFNVFETPEKLNADSTITKQITSHRPIFVDDIHYNRHSTFYLLPGETYNISLDSNMSFFEVKNNPGRTKEANALKELSRFIKKQKRINEFDIKNIPAIERFFKLDFKTRDSLLIKHYEEDRNFINDYTSTNNISTTLSNVLQKHILYQYYTTLFNFNKRSKKSIEKYIQENKVLYKTVLNEMNCDSCLKYPLYPYLTKLFAKYYVADAKKNGTEFAYAKYNDYFKGNTKDYLLYDLIKLGGMFNDTKPNPKLANQFLADASNPELKSYIKEMYRFLETNKSATGSLVSIEGIDIKWNKILAKHKGKVVYVDFWASWCGPCRAEMPKSHSLRSRLDPEKVVFIYVSMDENSVAWKKASALEGINKGESYILIQPDKSELKKQYQINSIPRYFLINKTGRIVNANAGRPGDLKIYNEIQQLL